MPITEEQRQSRIRGIGASDAYAMLGMCKYTSIYDLWLQKTGRVDQADISGQFGVELGNAMEPVIAAEAAKRIGDLTLDPGPATFEHFRAHCDAVRDKDGLPVEIKAGWHGGSEAWGDDGDSKVPDRVLVQLHVQMLCTQTDRGYAARGYGLPNGGFGFSLHPVTADPELTARLVEVGRWFWGLVESDTPPPVTLAASTDTLDTYLVSIDTASGGECELPDQLVRDYLRHKKLNDHHDKERKRLKAEIMARMADARRSVGDGWTVSKYTQVRPSLDKTAMMEDHPEMKAVLDEYTRPGTPHAQIRVTESKK